MSHSQNIEYRSSIDTEPPIEEEKIEIASNKHEFVFRYCLEINGLPNKQTLSMLENISVTAHYDSN